MRGTNNSVVAVAQKMVKPETKTVTHTLAIPKIKIVKQELQQQTAPKKHRMKRLHVYSCTTTVTKSTKPVSYYN